MEFNQNLIEEVREGKAVIDFFSTGVGGNTILLNKILKEVFPKCTRIANGTCNYYEKYVSAGDTGYSGWDGISRTNKKKYTLSDFLIAGKMIGYKFKKGCLKFESAAKKIIGSNGEFKSIQYPQCCFQTNSESTRLLKEAGVLDLWFEPVYEEQYKVGDYFVCNLKRNNYEGELDKIYKCTEIRDNLLYFDSCRAIEKERCRKATQQEIDSIRNLPEINNYKGKLEGDYVIYGCAKFHKDFFINILKASESNAGLDRNVSFITLTSGVEIKLEQIKQIVDFINGNKH